MMDLFKVGEEFASFAALKESLTKFQETTFTQFYVKDSRTVAAALKRTPGKELKPELKYSYLVCACIAGGKKFISKSNGSRPNQR